MRVIKQYVSNKRKWVQFFGEHWSFPIDASHRYIVVEEYVGALDISCLVVTSYMAKPEWVTNSEMQDHYAPAGGSLELDCVQTVLEMDAGSYRREDKLGVFKLKLRDWSNIFGLERVASLGEDFGG